MNGTQETGPGATETTEAQLRRWERRSIPLVAVGLVLLGFLALYAVDLRFKNPQRIDGVLREHEALYIVQSESLIGLPWAEATERLESAPVLDSTNPGQYTVPVEAPVPAVLRVLVEGGRVTAVRYELTAPAPE